jgi:hypothetical protein
LAGLNRGLVVQKEKRYPRVKFSAKVISEADAFVASLSWEKKQYMTLKVDLANNEEWDFDTLDEFLAAADQGLASYSMSSADRSMWVINFEFGARVSVRARKRDEIEKIFSIFEKYAPDCRLPGCRMCC